jgi:hypothetical protein
MVQSSQQAMFDLAQRVQDVSAQIAAINGSKTAGMEKITGPDGRMIGARILQADGTTREVMIQ